MTRSRSEELRAKSRKIFAWSYAIAAGILGWVFFVWSPEYNVETWGEPGLRSEVVQGTPATPVRVTWFFGPPDIQGADGTVSTEPPTRVLEAARVMKLPVECRDGRVPLPDGISGRVRLRVNVSGEAAVEEIVQVTGSACGDQLITAAGESLRYHWLPSEEFPAPVRLVQPVTVVEVAEVL